jgi:hypothetical protein
LGWQWIRGRQTASAVAAGDRDGEHGRVGGAGTPRRLAAAAARWAARLGFLLATLLLLGAVEVLALWFLVG